MRQGHRGSRPFGSHRQELEYEIEVGHDDLALANDKLGGFERCQVAGDGLLGASDVELSDPWADVRDLAAGRRLVQVQQQALRLVASLFLDPGEGDPYLRSPMKPDAPAAALGPALPAGCRAPRATRGSCAC